MCDVCGSWCLILGCAYSDTGEEEEGEEEEPRELTPEEQERKKLKDEIKVRGGMAFASVL
jgi:hypothetical protein